MAGSTTIKRTLALNSKLTAIIVLLCSLELGAFASESEDSETPHWSIDIPGFYHRLFFSGGETEVRAHHRGLTAVHNALPERGTSSLRLSNGKVLVSSFFLNEHLVSCRLETDPVEIADFYRSLTDDFNCAEQKKAESAAGSERIDSLAHQSNTSKFTSYKESRRQVEEMDPRDTSDESSSTDPDGENESSDVDFDETNEVKQSDAAREPFWCSIEDPVGRQIWNETFALLVNSAEQRELMREIRKFLQFRVRRRECRSLQRAMRRDALRKENNYDSSRTSDTSDEGVGYEVASERSSRSRRSKRSIFSSILPGTKWCGSGNHAKSFNELGASAKTDDCCREHDQCPYTLVSFQKRWGLRNRSFFTLSHCRCDERFRSCLKMARTSQSRFVGRMFFDLLSKQCFVFKKVRGCARLSWDGSRCVRKKWTKRAIVRDGMSYY
ncbi:uncharacterized protein LOC100908952 [Galendromus occidentalis]|uniref:Phospholipase A2 n=1 Tax=Galendromus occidentalis TaxID=34638 RepID=A0AAJ6QJR3_9ACAR|nr:uncharacterized protein LOC100908952 [Galendromus occidentalis]